MAIYNKLKRVVTWLLSFTQYSESTIISCTYFKFFEDVNEQELIMQVADGFTSF